MGLPNEHLAAAFRKSGKTQDTFCTEHGITIHKLRYYLYKKGNRRDIITQAKHRITATPRVPPPLPVDFISFQSHSDNNNDHTVRLPVTIITGRFSVAEVVEFVTKTGAVVC